MKYYYILVLISKHWPAASFNKIKGKMNENITKNGRVVWFGLISWDRKMPQYILLDEKGGFN